MANRSLSAWLKNPDSVELAKKMIHPNNRNRFLRNYWVGFVHQGFSQTVRTTRS